MTLACFGLNSLLLLKCPPQDFAGRPVVKDVGWIPGWKTAAVLHAAEQLSPLATATEPAK